MNGISKRSVTHDLNLQLHGRECETLRLKKGGANILVDECGRNSREGRDAIYRRRKIDRYYAGEVVLRAASEFAMRPYSAILPLTMLYPVGMIDRMKMTIAMGQLRLLIAYARSVEKAVVLN